MSGMVVKYSRDEAVKYFIDRCRIMARLNAMDNGIQPPTDEEMALALEDAFNYINTYTPETSFTPEDLLNDDSKKKYVTLYCIGCLKFTFEMLVAYISANLIDVVIDEFPISSRLNEYQSLLSQYEGKLEQKLQQEKPIMGGYITGGKRKTSLDFHIWSSLSYNSQNRYLNAMRPGGSGRIN